MTTLKIGANTREIFLEDLEWQQDTPEGTNRLGQTTPVFHLNAPRQAATATIQILFTTFTEARTVSQLLAVGALATLTEPTLGLGWNFRTHGTINVTPARIGNHIKAWRLTAQGVEQ